MKNKVNKFIYSHKTSTSRSGLIAFRKFASFLLDDVHVLSHGALQLVVVDDLLVDAGKIIKILHTAPQPVGVLLEVVLAQ